MNEDRPILSAAKMWANDLVSGGIRFMQIFAEVTRGWGIKRQCGCREWQFSAFSRAIFGYFRDEANIIIQRYAVRRRLFSDPKMHDLE